MDVFLSMVQQYVSSETLVTLTVLSIIFFVVSLIAIPFILVHLPADFFDIRVPRPWMEDHHPVLRVLGHLLKNIVGAIFLFAGFLMLFLPGQGILTMLIGISIYGVQDGRLSDHLGFEFAFAGKVQHGYANEHG